MNKQAFHSLTFKAKRLFEHITASSYGRYHDHLTESQRSIVGRLVELGLVEKFYASWTGELVYRTSPQCEQ